MSDLTPQDYPEASKCPKCGGEPTDEATHRLQNLGYLADDGHYMCEDCGNQWKVGRPIGYYEDGDDLYCDSCGKGFMRVHFIKLLERAGEQTYKLNLKCPNHLSFDCDTCEQTVHDVGHHPDGRAYCPHCGTEFDRDDLPGCFHYKTVRRDADASGRALLGFPDITGSADGAEPRGYPE